VGAKCRPVASIVVGVGAAAEGSKSEILFEIFPPKKLFYGAFDATFF